MLDSMSSGPASGAAVLPVRIRSTLAWVSGSRPPAPIPISATVMAGCGPQESASVVSRAAPVGVQDSALPGPASDGTPRSSSATAGGGTGMVPCAPRTVPVPTATGETDDRTADVRRPATRSRRTPRRRRRSRRAPRPRGRRRRAGRRRAPWPRRRRGARRRGWRGRGRPRRARPRWSRPRMSRQLRWCCAVGDLDVAAGGGEAVAAARSPGPGRPARGRPRRPRSPSTARGTPAPRSAPSSMSPLAPAEASTQTLIAGPRRPGPAGVRADPPGDAGGGHAGAVPVVDVDHGDAGGAGVEHAQQGGQAAEGGAVPDAGGDRDERRPGEATDDRGQGALHAGDDDEAVDLVEPVAHGHEAVQAGHADVADLDGLGAVAGDGERHLGGDRGVGGAGADDPDPAARDGQRAEGGRAGGLVDGRAGGAARRPSPRGRGGWPARRARGGWRAGWSGSRPPARGSCRRRTRPRGRRCGPRARGRRARSRGRRCAGRDRVSRSRAQR